MITTKTPSTTFYHVPKTGGESVMAWFKENKLKGQIKTKNQKHTIPRGSRKKGGVWWCVVRNPYDRQQSMYRYKCMKEHREGLFGKKRKGNKGGFSYAYLTFEEFCLQKGKIEALSFYNPQWEWAKHCDVILRFENLEKDFKQIQELYDCYKPLPRVNSSTDFEIDTTYTRAGRDAVNKRYQEDFENLGYKIK